MRDYIVFADKDSMLKPCLNRVSIYGSEANRRLTSRYPKKLIISPLMFGVLNQAGRSVCSSMPPPS
jgi:hypothetical protein